MSVLDRLRMEGLRPPRTDTNAPGTVQAPAEPDSPVVLRIRQVIAFGLAQAAESEQEMPAFARIAISSFLEELDDIPPEGLEKYFMWMSQVMRWIANGDGLELPEAIREKTRELPAGASV